MIKGPETQSKSGLVKVIAGSWHWFHTRNKVLHQSRPTHDFSEGGTRHCFGHFDWRANHHGETATSRPISENGR